MVKVPTNQPTPKLKAAKAETPHPRPEYTLYLHMYMSRYLCMCMSLSEPDYGDPYANEFREIPACRTALEPARRTRPVQRAGLGAVD